MKTKINNPIYIASIILIIFVSFMTKIIVDSFNEKTDKLFEIVEEGNSLTQSKLDGLASGQEVLNENDKVISEQIDSLTLKVDSLTEELGLLKEEVISLGKTNSEILLELEGIQSTLKNLRAAGYSYVTASQIVEYNKCLASAGSPTSFCKSILK